MRLKVNLFLYIRNYPSNLSFSDYWLDGVLKKKKKKIKQNDT